MTPATWQDVALQALNVAQTVLLAWLVGQNASSNRALRSIEARSRRVRRSDPRNDEPPG